MKKTVLFIFLFLSSLKILMGLGSELQREGYHPSFSLVIDDLKLERLAQPFSPWDKAGRCFAFIGNEGGSFEAWAYPLKLVRNFELSFILGSSTQPIRGRDIVREIIVTPAATIFKYTYQSFTVRAIFVAAIEAPGGLILLDISSDEPLTIVASFFPVLQPMWPAGLGGQYTYWDKELKAYLISEPTRKNHAYIGSPAAEGISYTPAHMLADRPSEFLIRIAEPKQVREKFIPIAIVGGKGERKEIRQIYEKLLASPERIYREALEHYEQLRSRTIQMETPLKELNLALEWAKISLDNLFVNNPDLGNGMVAGLGPSGTSGRPGFGWFFGGDAFINALALHSLGMTTEAKTSLAFTQKWQRDDGKMAHELSQAAAYINWFKDYPYAYIHGDTTPYYLVAVWDHYERTGDIDFLKKSWPSLRRAFDWCLTTDEDGDGLMDNRKAGLGALEYGELTGIQTDIYLAAVWIKALQAMNKMAELLGEKLLAQKATTLLSRALLSFEKFWDDSLETYVYAFNAQGERVKELTPWPAVALMWEIGQAERREKTLQKMFSSTLTTDWGVRVLSNQSRLYGPLNYNYGAVWPFITGFVAAAQFNHHFLPQAMPLLLALANHFFDNSLGHATEVFSGSRYLWPEEAVPHQGFSATGFVLPLIRGFIGLDFSFWENMIKFSPQFPADWAKVKISHSCFGQKKIYLEYTRKEGLVRLKINQAEKEMEPRRNAKSDDKSALEAGSKPLSFLYAPVFGPGVKVKEARVDGQPVEFEFEASPRASKIKIKVPFKEKILIDLYLEETVEILPPFPLSQPGDEDRGLKILNIENRGKETRIVVEGRKGEIYHLKLHRPDLVASVNGAELVNDNLRIVLPASTGDSFLKKEIMINLK